MVITMITTHLLTSQEDFNFDVEEETTSLMPMIYEVQVELALLKEQYAYLLKDKDNDDSDSLICTKTSQLGTEPGKLFSTVIFG